jgi:hypothetical protein
MKNGLLTAQTTGELVKELRATLVEDNIATPSIQGWHSTNQCQSAERWR